LSGVWCTASHCSCHVANGQWHSTVLSGHIPCSRACERSAMRRRIVATCPHVLQAIMAPHVTCLVGALVTRECTLRTCEPSCVPRVAKSFFVLVAHGPLRAMGHMSASESSPRGGRVQSHETRGSVRALPYEEAGAPTIYLEDVNGGPPRR
jgi:hypothetical protein